MKAETGWKHFAPGGPGPFDTWHGAVWQGGDAQMGPSVLITAGVHGDEYEGPAAVLEIARRLADEQLRGSVTAIPVVNPLAFAASTRTTPDDGVNLARVFPGNRRGTVTERLAADVFEHFARASQFVIDLHSGGVEYLFLPLAGFYGSPGNCNPSFAAARRFGLPVLWQLPETDGVLSREARRHGAVAIGHEYFGAGQLSCQGVQRYVEGVLSCLRFWGLLEGSPLPAAGQVHTGDWQLAAASGLFLAQGSLGTEVEKGDLIAVIEQVPGKRIPVFAERAGKILGLRSKAFIREGNWAVLVGASAGNSTVGEENLEQT
jgi:N-alpha-acetyl-L-2,4-diaminobutyrate deacetylase